MADAEMLAWSLTDLFSSWQLIALLVVIALIVFLVIYRRRQL